MKHTVAIVLLVAVCGCGRQRQATAPPQLNEQLVCLLASTHCVIVVDDSEPSFITNRTGHVLIGYPMRTLGTVTNREEVAELTAALAETGTHGDSGVCFCGALPYQVFVDANGTPLVGALVHVDNNHVILSTNFMRLDERLFFTSPTGEVFASKASLSAGDNPKYGTLALRIVERFWPEELDRREISRHN